MRQSIVYLVCATVAAAGLALTASNASAQVASATSSGSLAQAERAANLFGKELIGSDNQKIGKVDNLVVDLESEHILYVIVDASRGKVAVTPQVIGATSGNTLRANVDK